MALGTFDLLGSGWLMSFLSVYLWAILPLLSQYLNFPWLLMVWMGWCYELKTTVGVWCWLSTDRQVDGPTQQLCGHSLGIPGEAAGRVEPLLGEAFGCTASLDVALSVTAVRCVVWLYLYVENNLGEFCLDLLPNLTLLCHGYPIAFTAIFMQHIGFGLSGLLMQEVLLTNEATAVGKRDFSVCLFSVSAVRLISKRHPETYRLLLCGLQTVFKVKNGRWQNAVSKEFLKQRCTTIVIAVESRGCAVRLSLFSGV